MSRVHSTSYGNDSDIPHDRERPWSIGSELIGHYETDPLGEHQQASRGPCHNCFSQTSGIIEIHDGTKHSPKEGDDVEMEGRSPCLTRASTTIFDRVITDWWWW